MLGGFDGYDENDDPIQFGVAGYQEDSDGLTYMRGPCLGIVLSVHYADESDNLLYTMLQGDDTQAKQASHVEATVLIIYGAVTMYIQLDHVAILQGKCGYRGPSAGEPADWSEDIPTGCTDSELEEFYAKGLVNGVEGLSGDWVVVDFIGGVLQTPVIINWFPNPKNKKDAATKEVGRRFLLRRNNSEIQINKNGDLHITHRVGQYIQMRGETITIKHRSGQIFHMDEAGDIRLQDKNGNQIASMEKGWVISSGDCAIQLEDGNIDVYAVGTAGKMRVVGKKIDLLAQSIYASGGGGSALAGGGIKSVVTETQIPVFRSDINTMDSLISALNIFSTALKSATDQKVTAAAGTLDIALASLTVTAAANNVAANNAEQNMLTKVFKGE